MMQKYLYPHFIYYGAVFRMLLSKVLYGAISGEARVDELLKATYINEIWKYIYRIGASRTW